MTIHDNTNTIASEMRALLLNLARREDNLAFEEAAGTPYWAPTPVSVVGHRCAADALRAQADAFLPAVLRHRHAASAELGVLL